MLLRRLIILLYILFITNFLGLLDTEATTIILPIKDYGLILIVIYLIYSLMINRIGRFNILKPILYFIILVIVIIISMPVRGDITIIEAFKVGRLYLTLLFTFVVYDEVFYSGSAKWIKKVIISIALYYTLIVILNVLLPSFINRIFVGGGNMVTENAWGLENTTRYVIKGNPGILFIHLGFTITFFDYFSKYSRDKTIPYILSVLLLGMVFQGWRAPLIVLISICVFVYSIKEKADKLIKMILTMLLLLFLLFTLEELSQNDFLTGKLVSAYNEVMGESTGSLEGRINRARVYQIPMFKESMWFGYGFVHKNSEFAEVLGNTGERPYNLYDFDFGYITLLNSFGIFGTFIFVGGLILIILKIYWFIKRNSELLWLQVALVIAITFIVINFSFGALVSQIGLVPLSLALGTAQWELLNFKNANGKH